MNSLRIAIDGGAATGKSTVSKLVAQKLGIRYINTGQMYRLFALIAIKEDLLDNEKALFDRIENISITYNEKGMITTPDFEFQEEELETQETSKYASVVAAMPLVREVATDKQIMIGREPGVLMEGRDIGTVVMMDADYKIFIVVDPKVAAQRRVDQHKLLGEDVDYDEIYKDICERNERDANREVAPLKPTYTSIIIDSSNNTAEEIADQIVEEVTNG